MPQKSILKKNTNQSSFETTNYPVIDIEDEDCYLYGSSSSAPVVSKNLPPGIVDRTQSNRTQENSADGERPLSPISLRLKREMDNMDRNRRMPEPPKENNFWTPIFGLPKGQTYGQQFKPIFIFLNTVHFRNRGTNGSKE